jgi:two-component system chemotaxis sensor kinase CheA
MTATREQSIEELREWISATIDELNRTLASLRSGEDPVAIMPRLAAALSWSPVIDELVRLIEDPPVLEPARTQRAKRVLIVDDSEGYRALATRVLAVAGYEVKPAGNGSEAWAQLQQQPFDVVITDAEMPEMDGLELVQRVRASSGLAGLPVIVLTGRDSPDDERAGLAAGADLFLHKFRPDTVSTLLDHLARMTCER